MKDKKVFIALTVAFLIRLVALDQSLWLDEATTARVVLHYDFIDIITKFSPFDFHPPLYYVLMKLWTGIFGYSEIVLRLPSVIFSLLTGWLIYKIGVLLKNKTVGFWAMLFFLFNPLIVYYSQEARMYMMAVFLLSSSLFFLIKILQVKNYSPRSEAGNSELKIDLILFNLFTVLSFYTFYGSVFFIVSLWIYMWFKKQYWQLATSLLCLFVGTLPLLPLLYHQFTYSRSALIYVTRWNLVLGKATLKNLLLVPLKFSSGRISFVPKIIFYFISGIWALFTWIFVVKNVSGNKLLTTVLFVPLALGFVFSFFSPLLQYFRFLYCIVPLCLLLAISAKGIMKHLLLAGLVIFSLIYLLMPQFYREDWKSLAQSIVNEPVVYMIIPSSDPLKYYDPMVTVREIRTLTGVELEKKAVVIPYTTDIYGFDYKKALIRKGFAYKEALRFRGLWYEIWVRNKAYAGNLRYSLTVIMERIPMEAISAAAMAYGGPKTPNGGIKR